MRTLEMLALVQCLLMAAYGDRSCRPGVVDRLERIERYLIERCNRE